VPGAPSVEVDLHIVAMRSHQRETPRLLLGRSLLEATNLGSHLVDRLIEVFRKVGKSVGVIAVDPSSPFSGGAILGDRVRMQRHTLDPGVYIRSMANRGALGGLSEAALQAALLIAASGREVVLLELSLINI